MDNVLDLIWNNTTDAIFAIDYHGAVIDANPAFQNMLGWQTEELNRIAFPSFIVHMTKEEHQTFLSQLKKGQSFPYQIVKRKHKDGMLLDILASYWSVNNERILAIGMYKDFTEQIHIQRKLEESEYCYRTLVEYLPEAIVKQRNDKIEFANSSAIKLFGRDTLEEVIGNSVWDFLASAGKRNIQHIIETLYDGNYLKEPETLVDKFYRSDDKEVYAEVKIIPIGSKEKPDIQMVFQDVTEQKRHEQQLEYFAYHDPLTGLKNRRVFTEIVTESMEAAKNNLEKIAMMYIDIDEFKSINDTYGHDVGDQLLQQFAERLKSSVRKEDVLCRVGGDEFLVLLKDISKEKEIVDIAERMLLVFQEAYKIDDFSLHVTSSIGITIFQDDGLDYQSFIYRADQALYQAKERRNQYIFFDKY
nr:sensor domain-containing diguanylate cyclase [Bacillus sp. FJAT-50079]